MNSVKGYHKLKLHHEEQENLIKLQEQNEHLERPVTNLSEAKTDRIIWPLLQFSLYKEQALARERQEEIAMFRNQLNTWDSCTETLFKNPGKTSRQDYINVLEYHQVACEAFMCNESDEFQVHSVKSTSRCVKALEHLIMFSNKEFNQTLQKEDCNDLIERFIQFAPDVNNPETLNAVIRRREPQKLEWLLHYGQLDQTRGFSTLTSSEFKQLLELLHPQYSRFKNHSDHKNIITTLFIDEIIQLMENNPDEKAKKLSKKLISTICIQNLLVLAAEKNDVECFKSLLKYNVVTDYTVVLERAKIPLIADNPFVKVLQLYISNFNKVSKQANTRHLEIDLENYSASDLERLAIETAKMVSDVDFILRRVSISLGGRRYEGKRRRLHDELLSGICQWSCHL